MSPVTFTPGFSDFFVRLAIPGTGGYFASESTIDSLFARAGADFNARMLRCTIDWREVEAVQGQPDWSRYIPVLQRASQAGLKILPVVWNAPAWTDPVRIMPPDGEMYYPPEARLPEFGSFVADTLALFAFFGVSQAIEVWNEPNRPKWKIPREHYLYVLNAVLQAVNARSYPFNPTVISGGLTMDGNWEHYLTGFMNQCYPYAVGIHPYDTTDYTGDQAEAVDGFVQKVQEKWQAVAQLVTTDIWITEFGCTALAPFGEAGKRDALERLVGLNGFFTSRARCKSVLLYRYLPQSIAPDDTDDPYWDTVPVLDDGLTSKEPVATMLRTNWQNAPDPF